VVTLLARTGFLEYEPPSFQYWKATELDAIEATMSGGTGGSASSFKKTGYGKTSETNSYTGRASYSNKHITQVGSISYTYSTAGPDTTAGYTYYTIKVAGLCAAQLDGASSPNASILGDATLTVSISGNSESELLCSQNAEVYSNPVASSFFNISDELSDLTNLLSICAGLVNSALGTIVSIVSFVSGKSLSLSKSTSVSYDFNYGGRNYKEFSQAIMVTLKVPATSKATKVTVSYFVLGESSEVPYINPSLTFYVYGE
jgi:hypothetical protein